MTGKFTQDNPAGSNLRQMTIEHGKEEET